MEGWLSKVAARRYSDYQMNQMIQLIGVLSGITDQEIEGRSKRLLECCVSK